MRYFLLLLYMSRLLDFTMVLRDSSLILVSFTVLLEDNTEEEEEDNSTLSLSEERWNIYVTNKTCAFKVLNNASLEALSVQDVINPLSHYKE